MSQLNINVDEAFLKKIKQLMKVWGCSNKSQVIRTAVDECLKKEMELPRAADFKSWIGMGNSTAANSSPKFHSHDELWD